MISKKAPPRCTQTAGPQLPGELLTLCLVTTSTSLPSFNVFLLNYFFPQITCSSVLRLLSQRIPAKCRANIHAPGLQHSPCACVPGKAPSHPLWDSLGFKGCRRWHEEPHVLTHPCTNSHSRVLALPQILVPLSQMFHHPDKRDWVTFLARC